MKILISGSHFTPAQAVIEELQNFPDNEIVYIGRKHTIEGDSALSVESQILPKLGIKFIPIVAGRLRRNLDIYTLTSLLKIPVGLIQAFYFLIKEKPDVVVSFGGYVGLPVVLCSWLLSIPVMVHEQTLVVGLANSISNFFADKIAVSFDKEYSFSRQKVIFTGNPLRKLLLYGGNPSSDIKGFLTRNRKEGLPLVFIIGGNQGSHFINENIQKILEKLTNKFFIVHQSGDSKFRDFEILENAGKNLKHPLRYLVKKWFEPEDMYEILKSCKLAVSRSGANILTELYTFGVPTLTIPIPYLYKNEQEKNAKYFEMMGLCKVLYQKNLTPQKLLQGIKGMLKNYIYYKKRLPEKVIYSDAAKIITQEILVLANKENA